MIVDSHKYCFGIIPRYGEEWAPKTKAWIDFGKQIEEWKKTGSLPDQKPEWDKKKAKTHSNLFEHVKILLNPLIEIGASCYSLYMDKEFATKDILDWIESKGNIFLLNDLTMNWLFLELIVSNQRFWIYINNFFRSPKMAFCEVFVSQS
jgi:hypothetical protein